MTEIFNCIWVMHETFQHSSNEQARPWEKGGASSPVQGGPECANWGTWGAGEGSPRIRTPEHAGVPTHE